MIPKRIQKKIQIIIELNQKKQYLKAKRLCHEVLSKDKSLAIVWRLLASNAASLEQWKQAIEALNRTIELGENDLANYRFLAVCYFSDGQFGLAQKFFTQVFNRNQDSNVLSELAANFCRMGERSQAKKIYDILIAQNPHNTSALLSATVLELAENPYGSTWAGYRARHLEKDASNVSETIAEAWQGQPLQGKSILIWQDQGIADQIIFSRTYPLLCKDTKSVTVVSESRLINLLQNSFPEICFLDLEKQKLQTLIANKFDYQVIAGDLPQFYLTSKKALDQSYRALTCTAKLTNELTEKLPSQIKIGLSWFGGGSHYKANNRWSLPTEALELLANKTDISYYSLQYGDYKEQQKKLSKRNINIIDINGYEAAGDFDHYAALIQQMDIIVAVDNSAAILAAALGKEVWVLHPADPFWVWGVGAEHNWYPATRHFVKPWNIDWVTYIQKEVIPALNKRINTLTSL